MHPLQASPEERGLEERFLPTRWSVVLAAAQTDAPSSAKDALAELCRTYWPPLYGYVRSRGYSVHDAQDLTQGFFCHLIEHQIYTRADPDRGRFRAFLLTSVKHFLTNAYLREQALKRGGGREFLPLDEAQVQSAEARFLGSDAPGLRSTADLLFERQWAETLVKTALDKLEGEFLAEGKIAVFREMKGFIQGSAGPPPTYEAAAARLSMQPATVRVQVSRLRTRYRERLRAELRRTVETEEAVDEELRTLLRVLTGR